MKTAAIETIETVNQILTVTTHAKRRIGIVRKA